MIFPPDPVSSLLFYPPSHSSAPSPALPLLALTTVPPFHPPLTTTGNPLPLLLVPPLTPPPRIIQNDVILLQPLLPSPSPIPPPPQTPQSLPSPLPPPHPLPHPDIPSRAHSLASRALPSHTSDTSSLPHGSMRRSQAGRLRPSPYAYDGDGGGVGGVVMRGRERGALRGRGYGR